MILFLTVFIAFFVLDLIEIINKKNKKDIIVYISISIIAIIFAIYYYNNEYKTSFSKIMFDLLNIKV